MRQLHIFGHVFTSKMEDNFILEVKNRKGAALFLPFWKKQGRSFWVICTIDCPPFAVLHWQKAEKHFAEGPANREAAGENALLRIRVFPCRQIGPPAFVP